VLGGIVMAAAQRGALAKPVLVITITDGEPTDTPKDAILGVSSGPRGRAAPASGWLAGWPAVETCSSCPEPASTAFPPCPSPPQVIRDAQARLAPQYGPKALAFQFAQARARGQAGDEGPSAVGFRG
jgi:hypothetical protein